MKQLKIEDAIKEIKRELKIRMAVYPKQIRAGKLHRDRANLQYKSLELALEILEAKIKNNQGVQQQFFKNEI